MTYKANMRSWVSFEQFDFAAKKLNSIQSMYHILLKLNLSTSSHLTDHLLRKF